MGKKRRIFRIKGIPAIKVKTRHGMVLARVMKRKGKILTVKPFLFGKPLKSRKVRLK